jgi:uncharacterized protein YjbI with pentapeptide repeats
LTNRRLRRANLHAAKLIKADLREAKLEGADLGEAKLLGANLSGADLSTVTGLTQVQLNSAIGNAKTKIPQRLNPPEHWPKD